MLLYSCVQCRPCKFISYYIKLGPAKFTVISSDSRRCVGHRAQVPVLQLVHERVERRTPDHFVGVEADAQTTENQLFTNLIHKEG